ncbi:hypothetical protein BC939DRAFT_498076 [Gamsiella multidivaricata]|uniref:uncharacterized protein n=1 Tax=Gamsiella multidivaricata TaxID=101098 RepID=UPI00221F5233|nr:uncharacterized protein BC939DRAFT_498076 [Gamsiella multidivaricata]KAI7832674.1 hypothetical protein BC939DRAFT_498076 [Gamsiella multidivaricata]
MHSHAVKQLSLRKTGFPPQLSTNNHPTAPTPISAMSTAPLALNLNPLATPEILKYILVILPQYTIIHYTYFAIKQRDATAIHFRRLRTVWVYKMMSCRLSWGSVLFKDSKVEVQQSEGIRSIGRQKADPKKIFMSNRIIFDYISACYPKLQKFTIYHSGLSLKFEQFRTRNTIKGLAPKLMHVSIKFIRESSEELLRKRAKENLASRFPFGGHSKLAKTQGNGRRAGDVRPRFE